jgi:hypothetical protein
MSELHYSELEQGRDFYQWNQDLWQGLDVQLGFIAH